MRSNVKPCIYNVFTAPTFENLVKLSISSYLNVKGCTISEGFTSVMDLYSRKIISWVLSETLEASHVVECVEKAKRVRNVEKPLIFHCDRGCQYVSEAFQKATKGMIHSYSKKAYPWDNACIESFHALLKREWINRFKIFNIMHMHINWFLNTSKHFTIPCAFTVIVDICLQMNMRNNILKTSRRMQ